MNETPGGLGGKDVGLGDHEQTTRALDSDNESLPPYEEINTHAQASPAIESNPQPEKSASIRGPTVSSPFNFPRTECPPYSAGTSSAQRPFAIPQQWPEPAAPFLSAYPAGLLNFGITAPSWHSFLDTMSAFLTARVSK